MKKKILPLTGYILFGIVVFLISLIYTFPFERALPLLSKEIENQAGLKVDARSMSLSFPLKVSLEKVSLRPLRGGTPFNVDRARLSISPLSVITAKPSVHFTVKKGASTLDGEARREGEKIARIRFKLESSNLTSLFPENPSWSLGGKVLLEGEGKIPVSQRGVNLAAIEEGSLRLQAYKGNLSIGALPLPGLSSLQYKEIKGKADLKKGIVDIKEFKFEGDITGTVTGNIQLRNPPSNSLIGIKARFKPSPDVVKKVGPLISILDRRKGKDGYYSIDVRGSFGNPRPIL